MNDLEADDDAKDETEDTAEDEGEGEFASDREPYPLAWGDDGYRIDVPDGADCWMVKRSTRRGAPEILYAANGRPLRLALEADREDLEAALAEILPEHQLAGKYRLMLLDGRGKAIKGAPSAVVEIKPRRDRPVGASGSGCAACGGTGALEVMGRSLDTTVNGLTTAVVQLSGQTSGVIGAAGQVGLTRRRQPVEPVIVQAEAPPTPPPAEPQKPVWIQALESFAQLAPHLPQIMAMAEMFGLGHRADNQNGPNGVTGANGPNGTQAGGH